MHQPVSNSAFSPTLFLLFLSLSCSQYVCQSFKLILPSTVSPPRTSSSSSFASQQPNQQHIMPRQEKGKLNSAEEVPLVSLIRPPTIVTAVTLEATGTITATSSTDSAPSSPVEGTTANPSTWSLISAVPRAKLTEFCLLTILLLTFFLLICFLLLFWEQTSQPEVVKDPSTHRLLTLKTRLALKSEPTGQMIISAYGNCQLTLDVSDLMIKCTSISNSINNKETWKLIPNRSHSTSSDSAAFKLQSLASKLFCLATGSYADGFHLTTVDLCEQADRPVAEQAHLLFNLTVEGVTRKQSCVLFSIRSAQHPNECMGLHWNIKLDKVFQMEPCSGHLSQLFYIGAVDYGEELQKVAAVSA